MCVNKEIAKNILFYRKQNKMTQKALAEKIGVMHNTISQWENCTNKIDIDSLVKICSVLNVDFNDMLGKYSKHEKIQLNTHEQQLIKDYRSLSSQGKEYIRQTMYMAKNIYQEETDISNMENIKGA